MNKYFHIRIDENLEQKIKEVAKCYGMNASEYMRYVVKQDIAKCTPVEIFARNTKTGEKVSLGYYYADQYGFTEAGDEIQQKAWDLFKDDCEIIGLNGIIIKPIPFTYKIEIM